MLKKKRLIFTFTTGRSGTNYLAALLYHINKADVFHEPSPEFKVPDGYSKKQFWEEKKLKHIFSLAKGIYIETSHLFNKGYFEALINLGYHPDIIFLKRCNRDVAKSLYQLNTIPGKNELGKIYYITPFEKENKIKIKENYELSDYQRCYWYTLEVDARAMACKEMVLSYSGKFIELTFDELFKFRIIMKFVTSLGLPFPNIKNVIRYILFQMKKENTNSKKDLKKSQFEELDFKKEEAELLLNIYE